MRKKFYVGEYSFETYGEAIAYLNERRRVTYGVFFGMPTQTPANNEAPMSGDDMRVRS
jgi:hypothetical protein